jgi:hypothetical protein
MDGLTFLVETSKLSNSRNSLLSFVYLQLLTQCREQDPWKISNWHCKISKKKSWVNNPENKMKYYHKIIDNWQIRWFEIGMDGMTAVTNFLAIANRNQRWPDNNPEQSWTLSKMAVLK